VPVTQVRRQSDLHRPRRVRERQVLRGGCGRQGGRRAVRDWWRNFGACED